MISIKTLLLIGIKSILIGWTIAVSGQSHNLSTETTLLFSYPKKETSKETQKALQHLQSVLKKYQNRNIYMKVTKKTHIAALGKDTVEKGDFYLNKGRFRISMNSDPASLMVFDGSYLWYQPDKNEKTVLKFKAHPQIGLFSSLFNYKNFVNFFSISSFQKKKKKLYSYVLKPKQSMTAVSKMILSCGKNINAVKVLWKDLGNWQYYIFSHLWFRQKLPKELFVFNTKGFVILQEGTNNKPASN